MESGTIRFMRTLVLAAGLALVTRTAAAPAAEIPSEALLAHIKFLASDDLKGRGNGTEGLDRAAEYIAREFETAGLSPAGAGGTWFQPFDLVAGLAVGRGNELSLGQPGQRVSFTLGTSYYPLASSATDSPAVPSARLEDTPLVFAGYGVSAPGRGYDDYAKVDVAGTAVLVFTHEPQERDASSRLNGSRPLEETTLEAKAASARNRGAVALLVVSDRTHRTDEAPYGVFGIEPDAEDHGIPVLRIRRDEMKPLIDLWGLDEMARQIDADLVPRSQPLERATVRYVERLSKNRRTVRNVVGVLPGSDPVRAREAVVIGAHYDHVGLGGRFSVTPERTGEIHNGADDNASGTSAIIEIARAAARERQRFPRTLVFVAFAAEERGLLGSAHYVDHPPVPVEDTIGMLNLDMIGRARGGVDVSGLEMAPSLEADLKAAVEALGREFTIRRQGPGAGRSDDSSFLARRIPAINFFTGFHGDYHRPGDDWEKIDAPGTKVVATLAFELAARLASRAERPAFAPR
jgi:hypothetical protein